MAGTTTYYGISYPTSTDYVKDGATAMQTIATGFDSAVAIPTYNNQTGTTYTFVLADTGKTVTSNNAAAVTFTIPPQVDVAWANNATLTVRNLGAGVVTIAGGAGVTVTNTAQTVAQYGEVKLIRTASNAWTVVPASGSASGLTLITSQTVSNATALNFTNVFTSTYDNYKLVLVAYDNAGAYLNLRARMNTTDYTSTGHYQGGRYAVYDGSIGGISQNNGTTLTVNQLSGSTTIPQNSVVEIHPSGNYMSIFGQSESVYLGGPYQFGGYLNSASSTITGITLWVGSGTFDCTAYLYGYQK